MDIAARAVVVESAAIVARASAAKGAKVAAECAAGVRVDVARYAAFAPTNP